MTECSAAQLPHGCGQRSVQRHGCGERRKIAHAQRLGPTASTAVYRHKTAARLQQQLREVSIWQPAGWRGEVGMNRRNGRMLQLECGSFHIHRRRECERANAQ